MDEFHKVGLLPVEQRVSQLKLNHMFNIYNGYAPQYMRNQIHIYRNSYNTRNSISTFKIPRVKGCGTHTFRYTGTAVWNSLPLPIRHSQCKSTFKKSVKNHLMSQMLANS